MSRGLHDGGCEDRVQGVSMAVASMLTEPGVPVPEKRVRWGKGGAPARGCWAGRGGGGVDASRGAERCPADCLPPWPCYLPNVQPRVGPNAAQPTVLPWSYRLLDTWL